MALSVRSKSQDVDVSSIQEELLPKSRGAVYIRDPKKCRKCPVCNQNLYLYNINFEEMFLMCENSSCEFPFGYEALQIVRDESELKESPCKASKDFFEYPTASGTPLPKSIESILAVPTCSLSMSSMSDCDRFSQADPDELSYDKQETLAVRLSRQDRIRKSKLQEDSEVQSSLEQIKQMTDVIHKLNEEADKCNPKEITNTKWLLNLRSWQEKTGQKLLTDKENIELVKVEPSAVKTELKLSLDETSASIQILVSEGSEEHKKDVEIDKLESDKEC